MQFFFIILGLILVSLTNLWILKLVLQIRRFSIMAQPTLTDILSGVEQESTLEDGVLTLLQNAQAQSTDPKAIQAVIDVLNQNKAKLSAALGDNVPNVTGTTTTGPTPTDTTVGGAGTDSTAGGAGTDTTVGGTGGTAGA